ncbi:hypothetical protein COCNU_01G019790 [Cocos nucifera]|uniref:Uncharacterized protein n=1 Tax=Cocos nucifera TaxID=13894 RepID=A0A8K0MW25_COCNU|nr:hypothetical protein COCNU_01G019790 [Cocos nucifera]
MQRVQGLTEMVQAMRQPPTMTPPRNPPSGCQEPISRKSIWASMPVAVRKKKQRVEDPSSDYSSPLKETFSICSRKLSKVCDRDDVLNHKLREMDQQIEELGHVAPAHHNDVCTDFSLSLNYARAHSTELQAPST